MAGELRTSKPLWFPHHSTAPDHVALVRDGLLLLGEPARDTSEPSPFATDMVVRLAALAHEKAYDPVPDPVVAAAADEATLMLGNYLRRLEDVARKYAAHLRTCDRSP